MAYTNNNQNQNKELTHKQLILQQILICNKLFSGYEASPTTINPLAGFYDFTPQAHTGKAILLGVLTLEANARPILPKEYTERTNPIKEKIFAQTHCTYKNQLNSQTNYNGLGIIAPDAIIQLDAILLVHQLFTELIAAIYSLPRFSDAIPMHQIAEGEKITEQEIGEQDSIEFNVDE